ncbi:MAG: hypothetical protein IKO03_14630 [Lachnospiraceae bacterium]|nr:hypothetical protein [Lachnospiraceae bacterium]MBR6152003.1 hypothetical protein [Lachnospiraceae bacterium]
MKKRGLAGLAAVLMAGVLLTACGEKAPEESAGINQPMAGIGEILASAQSEASVSSVEETSAEAPKDDWSQKYDHYFEEHPIGNCVIDMSTQEEGMKMAIRFGLGQTEEFIYLRYVVWECDAKQELDTSSEDNFVTAYMYKSGEAYLSMNMKGRKTEYYKATDLDFANASQLASSDNPLGIMNDEEFTYDHAEELDGVTYDVLFTKTLYTTKSKANRWIKNYYYINRETQELEWVHVKDTAITMDYHISPLDAESFAEMPAEMKNGKKDSNEDFMKRFALGIVKITYNALGVDPNKLNLEAAVGLKK